jgi:diacylglycerol O-acyltransferase / wax synthase
MLERLSPLDAAFLRVESPTAHMHVGFAAVLTPPPGAQPPGFPQILEHVERRLCRAPRYRQMLAPVPYGLHHPAWVDDPDFDVNRHVVRSRAARLGDAIDECMSEQLPRDRPLWQIHVADRLEDGTLGVVGKAHHCMVDGIATVELASLLFDGEPEARHPPKDDWRPQPGPERGGMITAALTDRLRESFELARLPARLATSPGRLLGFARQAPSLARAINDSLRPAPPGSSLNESISPLRHLGLIDRPLADLLRIKRAFGVSLNDTVLAVSAAGVRRFLAERGEEPLRLKTMVPVNVRASEEEGDYGNRISFMFVDLPCDEPNAVRRLMDVHLATSERKDAGEPRAADRILRSIVYLPHALQQQASRLIASPRTFNLVVSNIPGPREPLYMCGCELERAYPVVPLADRHALSIGITTIGDRACFGLYCDRESLPDADSLAGEIDRSIDELLARCVETSEDPSPAFVL